VVTQPHHEHFCIEAVHGSAISKMKNNLVHAYGNLKDEW